MGNFHLINLKSGEKGKVPAADLLHYGELAVNYAEGGETVFLKNSKDAIVEIKPHAVVADELSKKQDKTDNALATTDKTVTGAINEISTKVSNLTGALVWKGKFDTLPAVTDYEAGNVVGVGNKEYVLTVTGNTKTWEELGDEGSYLLKSTAEETYLKKSDGAVGTTNLADKAITEAKLDSKVSAILESGYSMANTAIQTATTAKDTSDNLLSTFMVSMRYVELFSDNTDKHKASNKTVISSYFQAMASTFHGPELYEIPVTVDGKYGYIFNENKSGTYPYTSLSGFLLNNSSYELITIAADGTFSSRDVVLDGAITKPKLAPAVQDLLDGAVQSDKLVPTLEAITIKTSNTAADKAVNLAAIKTYVDNLNALGVSTSKGYTIPVLLDNNDRGYVIGVGSDGAHNGYYTSGSGGYSGILVILSNGTCATIELQPTNDTKLATTSKTITGAINELKATAESTYLKKTEAAAKVANALSIAGVSFDGSSAVSIDTIDCGEF